MLTQKARVALLVAVLFVALTGVAEAGLIEWQAEVAAGTPATYSATNVTPPPIATDIGTLSNVDRTYEFIVNGNTPEGAASQALIGVRPGSAIKFEQWNNTQRYGATLFGVVDHTSAVPYTVGADVHLAFVSQGGANRTDIYQYGVLVGSVPTAVNLSGTVGIGAALNSGPMTFFDVMDGTIHGVATYDAALPVAEIQSHVAAYNVGGPSLPNPIGYWNFDDVGSTAIDASGNPAIAVGDIQGATHVPGKFGGALDFNPAGANQVVIARANEALASLGDTEEVTVAFWQYGDVAAQPRSDTIFSAQNAGGGRVLQSHLPWGNSRVYWDAGNSYNRIDKAASPAEFEGSWQHWAFTKNNNTGQMKIYQNGALWLSGGGTLTLDGIASLAIGSQIGTNYYDGMVDDFAIWNTELSPSEIAQIATSPNALVFSPGTVRGGDLRNDAGRLSPGGDGAIGTTIIGPGSDNIATSLPQSAATQSSDRIDGRWGPDAAYFAIDGNNSGVHSNGTVTHTLNQSPSWWQLDLLTEQIIDDIVLWNRTDCCGNRLSNFRMSVLDAAENEVWGEDFFTATGYAPREFTVGVPDGVAGQFVRLDKLGPARDGTWITSLAEVEVLIPSTPSAYIQGPDGILTLEIGPLAATFDRLIVSGDVMLDGVLDVRGLGLGPGGVSVLDVLDWGGQLSGEFDDILVPDWDPASGVGFYEWDFSGFYTTGTIVLIHIPEPASLALLGLGALALRRRRRR
jgi:hypothetical protein